jgi:hypothetical protein
METPRLNQEPSNIKRNASVRCRDLPIWDDQLGWGRVRLKSASISGIFVDMNINLSGFSAFQQRALFDLLILAMYADGHLSTVEDELLQKLLTAMGFAEESDRQREFNAGVRRVRPFVDSIQQARDKALLLAGVFTTPNQQKQVYAAVQQIMTSDGKVSTWENTLLSELALIFRM